MKIVYSVFAFLSVIVCLNSCVQDPVVIDNPNKKDYTEFSTQVIGLSGLCFSKDSSSLLAVSDKFGIYELNFDGTTKRKLPYDGTNDFEAITINHNSGDIYVADESLMTLLLLSKDEKSLTPVTKIEVSGGVSNKGIEGLTYGLDTLYAVNQELPTDLIKYSLKSKTEVSRIHVTFAIYLSDICFDSTDNTLWICDANQKMLFHCNLNGQVIASQSISFIVKAEALLIDRTSNIAWIGCDQTGNLYRVKLKI